MATPSRRGPRNRQSGRGAARRGDAHRPGGGGTRSCSQAPAGALTSWLASVGEAAATASVRHCLKPSDHQQFSSWGLSMEPGGASVPAALPYYVAFSQLLGLTVVAVTGAWLGLYRGGIAWDSSLQFNVHPLCMVIGMIFLQGDALLVYRVFRKEAKRTTKILHGLLHVVALIIALVGLVAVFDYHRKKSYPDLYSLHSWCGILVFVLYFVQWLVGFSFFLFPGASFSLRSRYRPQHIFYGATIFLLSVGTALLGLKEALLFKLGTKYSKFEPEGVLANVLGLLLVCFGVVVLYILAQADWKRPSQAEEQALSMDFKTLTEGDSPSPQ